MSILRIALKVSADASLRVIKVPKFEPNAEIGQIGADFELGPLLELALEIKQS